MVIDENEFFREVSVRMCGSLEIDKALRLCFQFVNQVMPVDKLIILTYDRGTRCFRSVATADSQGARLTSEEVFLPPTPHLQIEEPELFPRARNVNTTSDDDPIIRCLAEALRWPPSSVLVNRLMIEGKVCGVFYCPCPGRGKVHR